MIGNNCYERYLQNIMTNGTNKVQEELNGIDLRCKVGGGFTQLE